MQKTESFSGVSVMNELSSARQPDLIVGGATIWKSLIGTEMQAALVERLRAVAAAAPLFSPQTRWGKTMSVRMTSAGRYGWFSDRKGYRYIDRHPSGTPWPAIPDEVLAVWNMVAPEARPPDCCLVNFYTGTARMGLHQDRDEADFTQPVVSISLGDDGLFRIGGTRRGAKTQSVWLASGDVLVLGGEARLAFHGVDRIRSGSSTLLSEGGRINLTLRVVD
jgi:alkylated DNA repair protein (DNA oxidative demethylase)